MSFFYYGSDAVATIIAGNWSKLQQARALRYTMIHFKTQVSEVLFWS